MICPQSELRSICGREGLFFIFIAGIMNYLKIYKEVSGNEDTN